MKLRTGFVAAVVLAAALYAPVGAGPAHAGAAAAVAPAAAEGTRTAVSPGANLVEVRRRYRRTGRNVAIGIGIATTAAIIASQARANDKSWCERLYRSCERGNDYNCRRFDRQCY